MNLNWFTFMEQIGSQHFMHWQRKLSSFIADITVHYKCFRDNLQVRKKWKLEKPRRFIRPVSFKIYGCIKTEQIARTNMSNEAYSNIDFDFVLQFSLT